MGTLMLAFVGLAAAALVATGMVLRSVGELPDLHDVFDDDLVEPTITCTPSKEEDHG
ncbi:MULTISPECIES: hypothetical protein [Streptosporangiaceae]|uniref:hypothetical protein n=1 Tax=Streptosporangiaceae TaxID=2004 RepID=UPI0033C897A2